MPANPHQTPSLPTLTRAIVWNQALWTAGHSLTTGGFLLYFGQELGATGLWIALLLAIPETVGVIGLATRRVIHWLGGRKRTWLICFVLARLFALGIPLLAFRQLRPSTSEPLGFMVVFLVLSEAFGSIAYVAYLSWLSDLAPESHWGRFFAKRDISQFAILLIVPVFGGYARDFWRRLVTEQTWSPDTALLAYVVTFAVGISLQLVSMIPLLRLPDVAVRAPTAALPQWQMLVEAWKDRSMRFLLIHNWWLAAANGLTQAAFFSYLFGPLGIGLGTYYLLLNVMNATKIPVSYYAGRICDQRGNKRLLLNSVFIVSHSLLFWLWATPEKWWLVFGAYFMWGGFAAVNIAGGNLALKLAPRSDNSAHLALFRQVGGLVAGISGLLGGLWLDSLRRESFVVWLGDYRLEAYQLLFLISWVGRASAALWILPIREPTPRPANAGPLGTPEES